MTFAGDHAADALLRDLVAPVLGEGGARRALALLAIDPAIPGGEPVPRAAMAMVLNVALFADLLDRVPTAAAYVAEVSARGERIVFDHGALRTIDGETGALPCGIAAFARILEPLGYEVGGVYPLPKLRMTGRAFVQCDFPEAIPQFFVSELHVSELGDAAQDAAGRVFGASPDPLGAAELQALDAFARDGTCPLDLARAALPGLVAAFGRQHPLPALVDYDTLLADSREAGWIATEGNSFNHATTRVPDVVALAETLKAQGKPMKADVEISANRRVRQTAFIADPVERSLGLAGGGTVTRIVPGSFYEFISRDVDPATGTLDLTFDSGNATGIFSVTGAR